MTEIIDRSKISYECKTTGFNHYLLRVSYQMPTYLRQQTFAITDSELTVSELSIAVWAVKDIVEDAESYVLLKLLRMMTEDLENHIWKTHTETTQAILAAFDPKRKDEK